MAVPAYIPINSAGGFPFVHTLPAFVICGLINDGHSDWCEVVSHASFDLHIAALFTIAKTWTQPTCPLTDDWIRKMWYIHTMEYYSAIKRNKIMPFTATWMELETLIMNEVSQKEKDKYHMI